MECNVAHFTLASPRLELLRAKRALECASLLAPFLPCSETLDLLVFGPNALDYAC